MCNNTKITSKGSLACVKQLVDVSVEWSRREKQQEAAVNSQLPSLNVSAPWFLFNDMTLHFNHDALHTNYSELPTFTGCRFFGPVRLG